MSNSISIRTRRSSTRRRSSSSAANAHSGAGGNGAHGSPGPVSFSPYPTPPNSLPVLSGVQRRGSASLHPRDSLAANGGRVKRERRRSEATPSSASHSTSGEIKCEMCGKSYKHISCLSKHKWEHTPQWNQTSKLSISKHQQVQLLEAASILIRMNMSPSSHSSSPSLVAASETAASTGLNFLGPDEDIVESIGLGNLKVGSLRENVIDEDEDDEEDDRSSRLNPSYYEDEFGLEDSNSSRSIQTPATPSGSEEADDRVEHRHRPRAKNDDSTVEDQGMFGQIEY